MTTEEITQIINQTIDKSIKVVNKTSEENAQDDDFEIKLRETLPNLL